MTIKRIRKPVLRCTCEVCGHVWDADAIDPETGVLQKPARCASCKRYSWNGEDKRRGKFRRERVSP